MDGSVGGISSIVLSSGRRRRIPRLYRTGNDSPPPLSPFLASAAPGQEGEENPRVVRSQILLLWLLGIVK